MRDTRKGVLKAKSGETINITTEGSLGLLAYGDIGIQLWRKERQAHHASLNPNTTSPSTSKTPIS